MSKNKRKGDNPLVVVAEKKQKRLSAIDSYIITLVRQFKSQFILIMGAIERGDYLCSVISNPCPVFAEKMKLLGYSIANTNSETCSFDNPKNASITVLEDLFAEQAYLSIEGELDEWNSLFCTAEQAKTKSDAVKSLVAEEYYNEIQRLINASSSTDVNCNITIQECALHSFPQVFLGSYYDDRNGNNMDQAIKSQANITKIILSSSYNFYKLVDSLVASLKEQGYEVSQNEPRLRYERWWITFKISWGQAETLYREMERYQPGKEGYKSTKKAFRKKLQKKVKCSRFAIKISS